MVNANTLELMLKNGLVSLIQGLNLQGDETGFGIGRNVYSLMADDQVNVQYPSVLVTTLNETERGFGGTTNHIWSWYPIQVYVRDNESARQNDREGDYQAWRLALKRALHQKTNLIAVPDPFANDWSEVEFLAQFPAKANFQFIKTGLRVRFAISEPRFNL